MQILNFQLHLKILNFQYHAMDISRKCENKLMALQPKHIHVQVNSKIKENWPQCINDNPYKKTYIWIP